MSAKQDTIFADGFFFELPKENAPSFIKGRIEIDVEKFKQFLNDHQNEGGFVKIDLKESKGQKGYAVLNTWKPTNTQFKKKELTPEEEEARDDNNRVSVPTGDGIDYPEEEINPEDIPF